MAVLNNEGAPRIAVVNPLVTVVKVPDARISEARPARAEPEALAVATPSGNEVLSEGIRSEGVGRGRLPPWVDESAGSCVGLVTTPEYVAVSKRPDIWDGSASVMLAAALRLTSRPAE